MDSAEIRRQVTAKGVKGCRLSWESDGQDVNTAILLVECVEAPNPLKGWRWWFDLDSAVNQDYLVEHANAKADGRAVEEGYENLNAYVVRSVHEIGECVLERLTAFGEMVSGVMDGWVRPKVSCDGEDLLAVWTLSYGLSRRFVVTQTSQPMHDAILSYRCDDDKELILGRARQMKTSLMCNGMEDWLAEAKEILLEGEKSVGSFVKLLVDQGVGRVK